MKRSLKKRALTSAAFSVCLVAACDERRITVSPNSNLTSNQRVVVTLKGFEPNASLYVAQCPSGLHGSTADNCAQAVWVTAAADGSATFNLRVQQQFQVPYYNWVTGAPEPGTFDCRYRGFCAIAVDGVPQSEWAPLSFVGEIVPEVSVVPTSNVPVVAELTVTGRQLPPATPILFNQCFVGGDCRGVGSTWTAADGTFDARASVQMVDEFGNACDAPGKCELETKILSHVVIARTPLTFDTTFMNWTATPTTNLAAMQDVTVSGSGVAPGAGVGVEQCFPGAGCDRVILYANSAGTYSGSVQLKQATRGVACDAPGKCTLRVNVNGVLAPAKPLSFKPVGARVLGTIQVVSTPIAGQLIQLNGTGWASNTAVAVGFGPAGSHSPTGYEIADAAGAFSATRLARSFLAEPMWSFVGLTMLRLVDCTTPGNCAVSGVDFRTFPESTSTPRAEAPVVVQPAAGPVGTASIQMPIAYATTPSLVQVTLQGGGWSANQQLVAYQCQQRTTHCIQVDTFDTNSAGSFNRLSSLATAVTVPGPYSPQFTCHDEPNKCYVLVTDVAGRTSLTASPRIPLQFVRQ
jgi:hypothetical protein